jgi:hypothetical protein
MDLATFKLFRGRLVVPSLAKLRARESRCSVPHVVHVSFGTDNFSQALSRLHRSAKRFGIRDVRFYRTNHPAVCRAIEQNPKIMNRSWGAGCWLWKPYILLDAMDSVEEDTIIIYTDAGQRYIADPSPLVALAANKDVVLFHSNKPQRIWTKRDCFVLMQADAPQYWDARQLDASIQIYRAGAKARSFLVELQDLMRNPRILCSGPNTCGLPNFEGFRAHRHDQSIITILAMKRGIETFPSPKIVLKLDPVSGRRRASSPRTARTIFEHHRRINEPLRTYWLRVIGEYLRLA